jgi:hypothetical protein
LFIITPQYAFSGAVAIRRCAMSRALAAALAEMAMAPSTSPLRSATSCVFSSGMKRIVTRASAG